MDQVTSILALFFVGIAFVSWVFSIIEWIGSYSFEDFFFQIGVRVVRRVEHMPKQSDAIRLDHVYEGREGKFKFLSMNECLFFSKLHLLNLLRVATPFAFHCRAKWNVPYADSYATVEGRFPLGPTVFFCCWFILVTVGVITLKTPPAISVMLYAVGPVFIGFSYFVEKLRFNTMVEELRDIVSRKSVGN